jgi:hypothetical protein
MVADSARDGTRRRPEALPRAFRVVKWVERSYGSTSMVQVTVCGADLSV